MHVYVLSCTVWITVSGCKWTVDMFVGMRDQYANGMYMCTYITSAWNYKED